MNSSNIKKVLCTFCELILMMILYAILDNIGGIKKYVFVLGISFFYLIIGRKKQWSIESVVCIVIPSVFARSSRFCFVSLANFSKEIG